MGKDLRGFLKQLQSTGEAIITIEREVRPADFEVTAILRRLEERALFPLVLFNHCRNVKGEVSHLRLISNVFGTRERCAMALDLPSTRSGIDLNFRYSERARNLIEPCIVPKKEARVKEVVKKGSDLDLRDYPIVRHHEMDPAPYIDMVTCHKGRGKQFYNTAFQRTMYKGPQKLGLFMASRHNWEICRTYEINSEPAPVIIVIGHHPAFYLGTLNIQPYGVDDYRVIGGLMNEPLSLVESETWGSDFLVPSDAEVVIEGEVLPNVREAEAPFGEWSGYYGPQRLSWVIDVKAMTHRRDAIWQDVFVSHRENWILGGVPKEGEIFEAVRAYVPTVKSVHFPFSGDCRLFCYISIDKQEEGDAKQAALIALATCDFIKYVVVVDADINPFNEGEVLWAVATRCQPSEDIEVIRNVKTSPLDPSILGQSEGSKMIIDATIPKRRSFAVRTQVPQKVLDHVTLEDYIEPTELLSIPKHTDSLRSV
jgi:2,5-furandicarboxylate decarboxylase 1